ncbi:MAG: ABC transporter substrate-binding protein [Chrysiogenetes bacterium]|nr:ABC transporter substrate-binding protein [Chrysiogenetes bacterium]
MKKLLTATLSLMFVLVAVRTASAEASPMAILRDRDKEVRTFLKQNPLPLDAKKRAHIEDVLSELFDYEYIAMESLGRHSKGIPQAKLKDYIDVFTKVTRRNASSEESLKTLLEGEINYEGEEVDENGNTIVSTLIIKNDEEIMMEYVFRKKGKEWQIIDYILDDVGLIENYKSSFGQIITDHGFDDLVRRLREKLDS